MRGIALPEVERRAPRKIEQARVLALALDAVVTPGKRIGEVVRQMLVQLAVLLVADLRTRPRPQRLRLIDGFELQRRLTFLAHAHREGDMVGIAADQCPQAEGIGEFPGFGLQVELDRRTTLWPRHRLHGELAVGARLPMHTALGGKPGLARHHFDAVGHDERRVEPDAELADELRVLLLIAGEAAEEFRRAGAGDGAEVAHGLLARHADPIVGDAQRTRRLVRLDADLELGIACQQRGLADGREAQPVVGVRGVRDQLAQEDLPVAVQGVDHELQQLTDLGLKPMLLPVGGGSRDVLGTRHALRSAPGLMS